MPTHVPAPNGAPTWVELSTSNPHAAQEFYAPLFGWTFDLGGDEPGDYVTISRGGSRVAGMKLNDPPADEAPRDPDAWITYFASSDAQATAGLADDSGGQSALAPT